MSDLIGSSEGPSDEPPAVLGPTVKALPIYTVNNGITGADCQCDGSSEICDEEYPQGLSYPYGKGVVFDADGDKTSKDLQLDIYSPDNTSENRPAFMFIHGGSFMGGSRAKCDIRKMAYFFASRGWVFISIDYRTGDGDLFKNNQTTFQDLVGTNLNGIVPSDWKDNIINNAKNDGDSATNGDTAKAGISMYTTQRDAKAALRWIVANAELRNINTDYITVGGNSAGAITAVTLGISNQEDFRDELRADNAYGNPVDPTLAGNANIDETYNVKTIVNFWGGTVKLDNYKAIYGHDRYDNNDPELFTAHGTSDPNSFTPPPRHEVHNPDNDNLIHELYTDLGIYNEYIPLVNKGHDAWDATVDRKSLFKLAFDFLVERQNLQVD